MDLIIYNQCDLKKIRYNILYFESRLVENRVGDIYIIFIIVQYYNNNFILLVLFIDFFCLSYKLFIEVYVCIRNIKEYVKFNKVCGVRYLLIYLEYIFYGINIL